jgi:glycosyltransferase involved in cell wall biosynthesis
MRVDLILLSNDENRSHYSWPLGSIYVVKKNIHDLNLLVENSLPKDGAWLFWDPALGIPNQTFVEQIFSPRSDLWHAGLKLGMGGHPYVIDYVAPAWMLNCDPPGDIEATSWRVSLRACLVNVDVLRHMPFLHPDFISLDAAALEWGHRCIRLGVITRHAPGLISSEIHSEVVSFEIKDQLLFLKLRFGLKWVIWGSARAVLSGDVPLFKVLMAFWFARAKIAGGAPVPYERKQTSNPGQEAEGRVSVIIPTIDRYPYLEVLLSQLNDQEEEIDEIIVIDQTPHEKRLETFYKKFSSLPLQIIFLDRIGQCSSRNAGLQVAKGEFVLFIDDDDEIQPTLLKDHMRHIYINHADVSSGVAHEVGAGALPFDFTYNRISDVFPTNNTLIHKPVLLKSGLFDPAYDHGARADADLGMRLYLSGFLMLLNPDINVLHHHAASGGLRTHKARVVTYAGSRASLLKINIPAPTEIYLVRRYFNAHQIHEYFWLSFFSSLRYEGSIWLQCLKGLIGFMLTPVTLVGMWRNNQRALNLLELKIDTPQLSGQE